MKNITLLKGLLFEEMFRNLTLIVDTKKNIESKLDDVKQKLREFATLFTDLFDFVPGCHFVINNDGKILEINSAAEKFFGCSPERIIGKPFINFMVFPVSPQSHPHEKKEKENIFQQASYFLNRKIITTAIHTDGTETPVELWFTRISLENSPIFICYLRDISAQITSEEALVRVEQRFRTLIENYYDVLSMVNSRGRIIYGSPSVTRVFGYPPSEYAGRDIFDLVFSDDFEKARGLFVNLLKVAGALMRTEVRLLHKDGSWRWYDVVGQNLLENPLVGGIVISCRDINDRKIFERALFLENERLSAILTSMGDGVITADIDGNVVFMNTSAEILTGWSQKKAAGKELDFIFHVLDVKSRQADKDISRKVSKLTRLPGGAFHSTLVSREGIENKIAYCIAPINNSDGESMGNVIVFRSVTEAEKLKMDLKKD